MLESGLISLGFGLFFCALSWLLARPAIWLAIPFAGMGVLLLLAGAILVIVSPYDRRR